MRREAQMIACIATMACSRARVEPAFGFSAAELPAARERGRAIYMNACVLCHGERADGHGQRASGFARSPADLHGAEFHGAQGEERVLRAIRDGLPGTPMAGWKDSLSDPELRAVAAYIVYLEKER